MGTGVGQGRGLGAGAVGSGDAAGPGQGLVERRGVAISTFCDHGAKISDFGPTCPHALRVDKGPDGLARD